MILADSNIVIYSRQQGRDGLRAALSSAEMAVCSTVEIEVLGWHLLTKDDEELFRELFARTVNFPLDQAVIEKMIEVRRGAHRITLGDAIIAATALVHDIELWTSNVDDFRNVKNLKMRAYSYRDDIIK